MNVSRNWKKNENRYPPRLIETAPCPVCEVTAVLCGGAGIGANENPKFK